MNERNTKAVEEIRRNLQAALAISTMEVNYVNATMLHSLIQMSACVSLGLQERLQQEAIKQIHANPPTVAAD